MAADDGPRETMVRDMKYERKVRTLVYRHLYRAIPSFLTSPTRDRGILLRCRTALEHERDSAANPQQRENLIYEIRALEAFENSLNALGMGGLNFEREFPGDDPRPSPEHCIIFHVFRQQRVAAPDPYRRKYRNIEAVCRHIARDWGSIQPPTAFDEALARYP